MGDLEVSKKSIDVCGENSDQKKQASDTSKSEV
jgi:hypothetical protein